MRKAGETVGHVEAGESAGVVLDRQLDISRGDWNASLGSRACSQCFEATLA